MIITITLSDLLIIKALIHLSCLLIPQFIVTPNISPSIYLILFFLMFSFYYLLFTIFQVFPCSIHYFDSIILLFSFFLELLLFYPWQFLSHTSTYLFYSIQVYQQFFYHLCLQKKYLSTLS